MRKLFLAMSICTLMISSSVATAVEPTKISESKAQNQQDIAKAAMEKWAGDLARDMQLSSDPLARAIAQTDAMVQAASDAGESSFGRLTQDQIAALYSAKSTVPVRIWILAMSCRRSSSPAHCRDPKLADSLIAADPKNAFTVLFAESFRTSGEMEESQSTQFPSAISSAQKQKVTKAEDVKRMTRLLKALGGTTGYYDYAQELKAPLLIAVNRRPPPPEVLAVVPVEIAALVAAFPPEQIAAEAFASTMIGSIGRGAAYSLMNACSSSEKNEFKAECARISELILANPKNSLTSAAFALSQNQNHSYVKRLDAFDGIEYQKVVEPAVLLSLDWLSLRPVLNKAVTQGDVAAIPDALAWAEQAYAKLPDKPAEVIAAERKAREEQQASWKAELDRADASEAQESAGSQSQAEAARGEQDGVENSPKRSDSSGGCSADPEEKVDPSAIEFKH